VPIAIYLASLAIKLGEAIDITLDLCALNLGAEDFATSAGIMAEPEALTMPKQMAVFAARAAGIMPLGFMGSIAEFHDLDGFRQTIRRSRRFGFIGASVIHPSQVAILNEEFRASAAEVDHARRIVAAYDKALAEGVGAVTVDGKMIDVPVVERAQLLLEREDAIAAREAPCRRRNEIKSLDLSALPAKAGIHGCNASRPARL